MKLVLKFSLNLYRLLLKAYPSQFRREYGLAMVQVFSDYLNEISKTKGKKRVLYSLARLWSRTLGDFTRSVTIERIKAFEDHHMITFRRFLTLLIGYLLASGFGLLIGYNDLRNTEVQPSVLSLLIICFIFGFARPKRAWLWALLIGGGVPLAHLIGFMINFKTPYKTYFVQTFIALIPALVGVYAGALSRRLSSLSNSQ